MDNEVKGEGNHYTTEFRQLDPRLGRWFSVDPLAAVMPCQSPYNSMDGNPIKNTDVKGDIVGGSLRGMYEFMKYSITVKFRIAKMKLAIKIRGNKMSASEKLNRQLLIGVYNKHKSRIQTLKNEKNVLFYFSANIPNKINAESNAPGIVVVDQTASKAKGTVRIFFNKESMKKTNGQPPSENPIAYGAKIAELFLGKQHSFTSTGGRYSRETGSVTDRDDFKQAYEASEEMTLNVGSQTLSDDIVSGKIRAMRSATNRAKGHSLDDVPEFPNEQTTLDSQQINRTNKGSGAMEYDNKSTDGVSGNDDSNVTIIESQEIRAKYGGQRTEYYMLDGEFKGPKITIREKVKNARNKYRR